MLDVAESTSDTDSPACSNCSIYCVVLEVFKLLCGTAAVAEGSTGEVPAELLPTTQPAALAEKASAVDG
jgi:hypothetical protein